MLQLTGYHKNSAGHFWILFLLIALSMFTASCNKSEKTTAEKSAQKTFATPAEAGAALLQAAKSGDQTSLLEIFGPDGKEVLFTGDATKDKDHLQDFVSAYGQMNRWGTIKAGAQVLYIGADNYAFPITLGQNSDGRWYFDTAAGKDEILARRIGKGELSAIAALNALVDAEHNYFNQTHDGDDTKQYAQKFVSDDGKQNGLYWQTAEGQPASPLGPIGDFAKTLGYTASDKSAPFQGYSWPAYSTRGGCVSASPGNARSRGTS